MLGRAGRIKTNQTDRRREAEHRDHDRVVIDRVHENVAAVALVVEGVEFDLADAAREFLGGGERPGGERGDDGDVHHCEIPVLRNDVAASVDDDRQVRFRFFQEVAQHPVERGHIFDREDGNGVHVARSLDAGVDGR